MNPNDFDDFFAENAELGCAAGDPRTKYHRDPKLNFVARLDENISDLQSGNPVRLVEQGTSSKLCDDGRQAAC